MSYSFLHNVSDKGLIDQKNLAVSFDHQSVRETAYNRPRDFLGNRFVYVVISSRAHGLSVGVNMNPDKRCNFNCSYCEVERLHASREGKLEVEVMADELLKTLTLIKTGKLAKQRLYQSLSGELLKLRQVGLSGDGEPTLAPNFMEVVEAVVRIRALEGFFKIVLYTNGTGLDQDNIRKGLEYLTGADEIWIKLDGGTEHYLKNINHPDIPLEKILSNILIVGRIRPIVIQSLFPAIHGEEPRQQEIQQFACRLQELKEAGARISLVQIYSAARPGPGSSLGHLPLRVLSQIAQCVRQTTGLPAEVF